MAGVVVRDSRLEGLIKIARLPIRLGNKESAGKDCPRREEAQAESETHSPRMLSPYCGARDHMSGRKCVYCQRRGSP